MCVFTRVHRMQMLLTIIAFALMVASCIYRASAHLQVLQTTKHNATYDCTTITFIDVKYKVRIHELPLRFIPVTLRRIRLHYYDAENIVVVQITMQSKAATRMLRHGLETFLI